MHDARAFLDADDSDEERPAEDSRFVEGGGFGNAKK